MKGRIFAGHYSAYTKGANPCFPIFFYGKFFFVKVGPWLKSTPPKSPPLNTPLCERKIESSVVFELYNQSSRLNVPMLVGGPFVLVRNDRGSVPVGLALDVDAVGLVVLYRPAMKSPFLPRFSGVGSDYDLFPTKNSI